MSRWRVTLVAVVSVVALSQAPSHARPERYFGGLVAWTYPDIELPGPERSSVRWLTWAQELLLTYAFFV